MALWCLISELPGLWYNGTPDYGYTEGDPTALTRLCLGCVCSYRSIQIVRLPGVDWPARHRAAAWPHRTPLWGKHFLSSPC